MLQHARSEGPPCVAFARYLLINNFTSCWGGGGTGYSQSDCGEFMVKFHGKAAFSFLPFVKVCPLPFVSKFPKYKRRKSLSKSVKGEVGGFAFPHLTHLSLFPTWISWSCQIPSLALQDLWKAHLSLPVRIQKLGQAGSCGTTFRAVQRRPAQLMRCRSPAGAGGSGQSRLRGSCKHDTKRSPRWATAGMKETLPAWPRFQMSLFKPER